MTSLVKVLLGTAPTGTDGDPVRTGFTKANSNVDVLNAQAALTSAAASVTTASALTAALHLGRRVNISLVAAGTVQVPAASTCGADGVILLRNIGATIVTTAITTGSGDNLSLSKLNPGEAALIDTDGVHAWAVLTRGRTNLDNEVVNGALSVGGALTVSGSATLGARPTFAGATAWDSANMPALSGRNKFINGPMQADQRGNGAPRTFTAGAALLYCVDRWYGYCTGANVTGQRVAGSGRSQYRYQFTGAAGVTSIGFGQRIETSNSFDLNGTTATLAVDLANSLLATVSWSAYYANTTDTFGTLAAPTKTLIASGSFNVTNAIARYTAPISVPAAATTGIEVVFSVGAQTSGIWVIGDAQIEPGSVATPVERLDYSEVLRKCQRYYEVQGVNTLEFGAYSNSANSFAYSFPYKVTKFKSPNLAGGSWGTINCSLGFSATIDAVFVAVSVTAAGAYVFNNAAALASEAEL